MKSNPWRDLVNGYTPKGAFSNLSRCDSPTENEIKSFIRTYIFGNVPYFTIEKTLVYDDIIQYIAQSLDLHESDIDMTGSAKLGFSLKATQWLRRFTCLDSDLDFFAVSENMFQRLYSDIGIWEKNIKEEHHKKFQWVKECADIKGFIDTWHIPGKFPMTKNCQLVMYNACLKLNKLMGARVVDETKKSASIRCYKNYDSALAQITINIQSEINKVIGGKKNR